ncbi:MAG: hypothetical protein AB2392_17925 [Neobacillus sp.]
MATETIFNRYTLNESEAKKIISAPRTTISDSNVFNDVKLNKSDRIANAARILDSRKCK